MSIRTSLSGKLLGCRYSTLRASGATYSNKIDLSKRNLFLWLNFQKNLATTSLHPPVFCRACRQRFPLQRTGYQFIIWQLQMVRTDGSENRGSILSHFVITVYLFLLLPFVLFGWARPNYWSGFIVSFHRVLGASVKTTFFVLASLWTTT